MFLKICMINFHQNLSFRLLIFLSLFFGIFQNYCSAASWTSSGNDIYYNAGVVSVGTTPVAGQNILSQFFNGQFVSKTTANNGNAEIQFKTPSVTDVSVGVWGNTNIYGPHDYFYIYRAGQSRLVIDTIGNVGIGSSTGAYKLSVTGDINFTGNIYKNGVLFSSLITGNNTVATSSIDRGWTGVKPSDIITAQACMVSILGCWAAGLGILMVIAFLWNAIKKVWIP
jgi:phage antirepressor YoqD-like protein